ncbi:MAG: restriction endonuclease [bacterium]
MQKEGLSELQALEQSDLLIHKIKVNIRNYIIECQKRKISPKYIYNEYDDDYLVRIDLLYDGQEAEEKRRVILWKDKIFELIKKLDWEEFEKVCKIVLDINDISDSKVTRRSKEGGVDVYGWLKFNINSKRILSDTSIRIVGQGKHKTNASQVSNADVSEFVTDIDKLRKKQGSSLFVLPDEFVNSPTPIIPVIITNGYFSPETEKTAINYGIITWNGVQISEDIATHFDLSFCIKNNEIDEDLFKQYLNNM